jgi:hypothetical protein
VISRAAWPGRAVAENDNPTPARSGYLYQQALAKRLEMQFFVEVEYRGANEIVLQTRIKLKHPHRGD